MKIKAYTQTAFAMMLFFFAASLIYTIGDSLADAAETLADRPAGPEVIFTSNHEAESAPTYTAEDLELMALVIYQEAGADACSDETRLMVGNVVMNRVADERYPDTIEGVLLEKGQYGRLYWTGIQWPERASNPEEAHAVERAYRCAEEVLNGVRLLPDDVIFQSENVQGTEIVAEQDGLYFCR